MKNTIIVAVRTGLEPVTPCVTGMYSNQAELTHHLFKEPHLLCERQTRLNAFLDLESDFALRAANETRTRDPDLGKVVLYQLSYCRSRVVGRDGFEPPKA